MPESEIRVTVGQHYNRGGSGYNGSELEVAPSMAGDRPCATLRFRKWFGPRPGCEMADLSLTVYGENLLVLSEMLAAAYYDQGVADA